MQTAFLLKRSRTSCVRAASGRPRLVDHNDCARRMLGHNSTFGFGAGAPLLCVSDKLYL